MIEYKAPNLPEKEAIENKMRVFFAGSIDNGKSVDWQKELIAFLAGYDITIFNPRRDKLEADLTKGIQDNVFVEQVKWELDHILAADLVVFFIQNGSLSPITLYELGLISIAVKEKKKKAIVCCEPGFWREGNVDVVCDVFGIKSVKTMDAFKDAVIECIDEHLACR